MNRRLVVSLGLVALAIASIGLVRHQQAGLVEVSGYSHTLPNAAPHGDLDKNNDLDKPDDLGGGLLH